MRFTRFRVTPAVAAGIAALVFAAPTAQAGPLVASATSCEAQTLEQPFLPWMDPASYVLAPAGTLEGDQSAWSFTGNAARVAGNEPYYVNDDSDSAGLSLPGGSSATTGSMCVGIEHPTLRIFGRSSHPTSTLTVDVLFEDAWGAVHSLTIGNLPATWSWQPSAQMPVVVNLLPLLPGERTAVAFRFTPHGGNWRIDDVYVDPHQSR